MSVDEILSETPSWFRRLIIPLIVGAMITVPVVIDRANASHRTELIEIGLRDMSVRIDKLEKRHSATDRAVQRYEIKQAVMDEKLDRIVNWIERQE